MNVNDLRALNLEAFGAPFKALGTLAAPLTTHATPSTNTTHAHTLKDVSGNGRTPTFVILQGVGTTAAEPGTLKLVAIDATNITVQSNVASSDFIAYVC